MNNAEGMIIWLIIAIVLLAFEAATVQLVSIWFAVGTIPAMIASGLGADLWLQLLVFLVASIIVLVVGRPILKEKVKPKKQATNADRVIGMTGIVLEDIDNLRNTGRVSANGLEWTARAPDTSTKIKKDTVVKVLKIDGVKIIVTPV